MTCDSNKSYTILLSVSTNSPDTNVQYTGKNKHAWFCGVYTWDAGITPPCVQEKLGQRPTKGHRHISQRVYELITEILCSNFNSNNGLIRSKFCTCHDSSAVMTCAKL